MARDKKYNIIEEVSHCSGYDYALMTTFNFDIKFFERTVFNPLYARGLKRITVFVDAKELSKSIKEVENCQIGRKYMVNPIEMNGSFHPKVILLLGKNKAKLFVGSANLTTSGQTTNKEVFNFYEYSEKKPENVEIINAAINFFIEINNLSYGQDNALIREAVSQKYYKKLDQTGDSVLLYNTKTAIIDQLSERINQKVKEIKVVVPYYDQQLSALKALKKAFPDAKIHVYLYKYLSTFPTEIYEKESIVDEIDIFEGFNDDKSYSWNNFYHGKVFLFKCSKADYVLYGSANCTQSALVKTITGGGNIECDCFEKGASGEFDGFINNLHISTDENYISRPLSYDKEHEGCFYFKYGKYEECMKLHFGYTKKEKNVVPCVGDVELQSSYADSELIVCVPDETLQVLPTLFDVTLTYGKHSETIRCWGYIPSELDGFRYSTQMTNTLEGVDIDSSGDKFAADYSKIIDAMNLCAADINEIIKMNAMNKILKQQEEENDNPGLADNEEFVVEDTLADVDQFEYRRFDAVAKFRRKLVSRFLSGHSSLFFSSNHDKQSSGSKDKTDSDTEEIKPRKATTEEKRLESFVKREVKKFFNSPYLSDLSTEHYLGMMAAVFEVFKQYCKTDPVEDIFDVDYVIDTRIEFYRNLLSKELKDTEEFPNLEETIITNCFTAIIENRLIDDSNETENINRAFLSFIEKKYHLRDDYIKYIKKAVDQNEASVVYKGFNNSCDYIDMLYGYKSNNQLFDFIAKVYKGANVELSNKVLKIVTNVSDINEHGVPNKDVLVEIVRYAIKYEPVSTVIIDIHNNADIRQFKNIRTRIKHTIRMETHQWVCETEYKNGLKDKSKSRYYDF